MACSSFTKKAPSHAFCSFAILFCSTSGNQSGTHSRQKRLIFMDSSRRLTLPPSTELFITFTLTVPTRNLPLGYTSKLIISIPINSECSPSFPNPFPPGRLAIRNLLQQYYKNLHFTPANFVLYIPLTCFIPGHLFTVSPDHWDYHEPHQ